MTNEELETEALFFRLLNSYLLQRPCLKDDYGMLLNHYKKHKETFHILRPAYIQWIGNIQDDLHNNRYSLLSGNMSFDETIPEAIKKEKTSQKHSEICHELVKRKKELLEPFTGPLQSMNFEQPTIYGPIDIYAQNGSVAYVIEVKTNTADHSIIGQVMKYYIGLCHKLILKMFEEVKTMTVCPGYDSISLKGLKRIGTTPILFEGNPINTKAVYQ